MTYALFDRAGVAGLGAAMPDHAAALIAAADRTLRHEFNLLGSGVFVPVDPDRAAVDGYQPIDWYLDPVRGLRFPRGVHHKAWKLYEMRPGNADVKYPWELARCQHWVTLGQAYRLTGDERYAREIANQLGDFVAANPTGVGINWTCTMDVGLRAVSWVIALDLVRDSALDEGFWVRAAEALFDHGLFIKGNLENTYEVTSNHFLSNVVGLWFLAGMFDDLDAGAEWEAFARTSLEQEIDVQVLPDGADFESSVPYHRLVAELFLGSSRLADFRGRPLSDHYRSRVRDMAAYLADVTRPDGLMPQSGDADDGRLHIFGGLGTATPQDGRHLLGPASAAFEQPEWAAIGGADGAWEAAWWGQPLAPHKGVPYVPPVSGRGVSGFSRINSVSKLYPDAGHAVVRNGDNYLLVTNSIVGTKGFGNHKHNDQLGFEYHAGTALVVDPGSYVYTSDPAARNLFRSTAYHNTLMIDGVEQNEINPEWLFRTFEKANAEHVSFTVDRNRAVYHGRHGGYTRLPEPVTHERTLRFDANTGLLEIDDVLSGSGRHRLAWHFHLAPGVTARVEAGRVVLRAGGREVVLTHPPALSPQVVDAWYSPSYGARVPCIALDFTADAEVSVESRWRFVFAPEGPPA